MRDRLDGEDFLHGVLEMDPTDLATGGKMDDSHSADAFLVLQSSRNGDAAEDGGLADLRKSHEREVAVEAQAACEAVELADWFVAAVREVDGSQAAIAGLQQPQASVVPARGVRHGESLPHDLAAGDVDQHTAVLFVFSPAVWRIRNRMAGHEGGESVAHRQAIQVAAVLRAETRDELRPPARHEAMVRVQSTQAREQRVDEPEFCVPPGQFVDVDVSGDVTFARDETAIGGRRWRESFTDSGHVPELHDVPIRAECQPSGVMSHAHRSWKASKVRVEFLAIGSTQDDNESGLIGRNQQRDSQPVENLRDRAGRATAER